MIVDKVVYDSNVFVAAAFNPGSSSGQLIAWARADRLRLQWHTSTLEETRYQLKKIPPLSWEPFAALFSGKNQFEGELAVERYPFVPDPDDRKFAALAEATGAMLVTSDDHLLAVAAQLSVPVLAPARLWKRWPEPQRRRTRIMTPGRGSSVAPICRCTSFDNSSKSNVCSSRASTTLTSIWAKAAPMQ
jgi:uncharacterized protein